MLLSLFSHLQSVASDPIKFRAAIEVFNDRLGEDSLLILNPRWPGVYPDLRESRCFVIMPFRDDLKMMYDIIANEFRASGIKLIRGDVADEQQIVLSIWEEIGRATHMSDHQQSWGFEDGPWKGPEPPLLVAYELTNWTLSITIKL